MYPTISASLQLVCVAFLAWGAFLSLFRRDRRKARRTAAANAPRMRRRSDKVTDFEALTA